MPVTPSIRRRLRHEPMKPLDAIDRQLIALLQDNARLSTVALAKAVGLSRSTVQERLQRLENAGVIAQYTVRLAAARIRCRPGCCCATPMASAAMT
jgi:DNA-binding Lrp family transcriptional regulator